MIELGQLEAKHSDFQKRNVRILAISLEDQDTVKPTQESFPNLIVVADAERGLANEQGLSEALEVIHPGSGPDGDTAAPTTILVDGSGTVRWVYRPDRFFRRLSPEEVLAAVDEHMPAG